jgi:hypothetical protein
MSNNAALSKLARLSCSAYQAAGSGNSSTAATLALLFESFNPGAMTEMIDLGDTVGGFSNLGRGIELTRNNRVRVAPTFSGKPSVGEWEIFWPWILSHNPSISVGTFTYAPSVVGGGPGQRNIDWHDTQDFYHLKECTVSRATLSAQSGGEVKLDCEFQGIDYTKNSGSYPTLTNHNYGPRFLFGDLAATIAGNTVAARSVRLTIDHATQNDRFFYGFTSAGPVNTDRVITLELDVPHGIMSDLTDACAIDGGASGNLIFTYGTSIMQITFPKLRSPAISVPAQVPSEMFFTFRAQAYCTLSDSPDTPEITVALTP